MYLDVTFQENCFIYQKWNNLSNSAESKKNAIFAKPLQSTRYSLKVRYSRTNIGIISIAQKMCCVLFLSFVFWIFPPLDTAVHLESAGSKQNTISKSLFQHSFRHICWAMRKMHHTFWKKRPLEEREFQLVYLHSLLINIRKQMLCNWSLFCAWFPKEKELLKLSI